ncbi:MAG: hypothetical protein JNM42_18380 [Propionivibrio sp.]|uniref:hypothetical protein n=1 Tax=Propionivibrio sp. TaxID=2212460 RepID=UPI001A4ECBEB|nr:hypothetical protein [Propionivibrio sp.]MBL8416396.1 hypothetical protein [Propionivibrio sp.]
MYAPEVFGETPNKNMVVGEQVLFGGTKFIKSAAEQRADRFLLVLVRRLLPCFESTENFRGQSIGFFCGFTEQYALPNDATYSIYLDWHETDSMPIA